MCTAEIGAGSGMKLLGGMVGGKVGRGMEKAGSLTNKWTNPFNATKAVGKVPLSLSSGVTKIGGDR